MPPPEMLESWRGSSSSSKTSPPSKARGRTGPRSRESPSTSADNTLASALVSALVGNRKRHLEYDPPSSPTPHRDSSPPPAIEDELDRFLMAFASAKKVNLDTIHSAKAGLSSEGYSPDSVVEASSSRLQELTKLSEGASLSLKKFAKDWTGRMDAKRARRK